MVKEIPPDTVAYAEKGHPRAQFNLGWHFKHGVGTPKDPIEAAKWWRKAAEQNYPAAQYSLGFDCYDQVGQNEAYQWIDRAANNGHQQAQVYLGWMYFCGGLGLKRDLISTYKWLTLGTKNNPRISPRIFRVILRLFMGRQQIEEAERLADDWQLTQPHANQTPR